MSYSFRDGAGALKNAQTYGGDGTVGDPYLLSQPRIEITGYAHSNPSITNAGATVLASNPNRKGATIHNRSTTDIVEITFGAPAKAYGQGLPLAPGEKHKIDSTNLYFGAITARTNAGITADLAVIEGV